MHSRGRTPHRPVSRRDFLRRTGASAFGAVAGGLTGAAGLSMLRSAQASAGMVVGPGVRRLGRTDLQVSELALGCGALRLERRDLLEAALDSGINLLDVAPAYGDGAAEEIVGRVLAERGTRDRVVIMTREVGLDHAFLATQPEPVTDRALTASVDASLERLRTDHIDVFICPQAADSVEEAPYPQLRSALNKLRRAGKVRFFGLSTHENYAQVSRAAILGDFYDVLQTILNPAVLESDLRKIAEELGRRRNEFLAQQAERIAARGDDAQFRGPRAKARRRREETPECEDMREIPALAAAHDVGLIAARATNTRYVPAELDPIIAERFGRPGWTRHQTLYRYVLQHAEVASTVVGAHTLEQLREATGIWGS